MQAMICDRCGRFIPKNTETGKYEGQTIITFELSDVYWQQKEATKPKKDICNTCMEDFQRWLDDESCLMKGFKEALNKSKESEETSDA